MDDDEYDEPSEVEKSINDWRQSERKVMIDTIQDLIQTSHKYAKSQYTPSSQRVRWTLLAGKLIWYKDQILKSLSLEALTIEMNELKKQMIEDEQRRERESLTRNYPLIGFRKPGDRKREDEEGVGDGEPRLARLKSPKLLWKTKRNPSRLTSLGLLFGPRIVWLQRRRCRTPQVP